jgi:anti-anti-sigma factor
MGCLITEVHYRNRSSGLLRLVTRETISARILSYSEDFNYEMRETQEQEGEIVRLSTELNLYTVADLRDTLIRVVTRETDPCIDLSRVEVCDTAGLQVLCSAKKTAVCAGKKLRIVNPSTAITDVGQSLGVSL